MHVVCHVIFQDHVIKGPSDFIGRSPSWYAIILPSLVAIDNFCLSRDLARPRDQSAK